MSAKDIKTKPAGNPKVLDAAKRAPKQLVKNVGLQAKEKASNAVKDAASGDQGESLQGYASDKVRQAEEWLADKGEGAAHVTYAQGKKLAQKTVRSVKERRSLHTAKEAVQRQASETAASPSGATPTAPRTSSDVPRPTKQATPAGKKPLSDKGAAGKKSSVRTKKQTAGKRTIKTRRASASVKAPSRTVKTADRAGKQVKTAKKAAEQAARKAKAAAKASQQAVSRAKKTAQVAAKTARATGRAVVTAVKATIAAGKALLTIIAAGGWVAVVVLLVIILLVAAIFALTGGGNSDATKPVSSEVEAHTAVIQKYARQYDIADYEALIKAVMMQESGGRGNDPMQASESGYNTRYPNKPGGITDSEYSINVGIQTLAACLKEAEAESPIDLPRIKLALQGYNFGNGYIAWAVSHYGGYSAANAMEFATLMTEKYGWADYGDTQYVPHVLRYYPFGRMPMGSGSQAIVQVALTQEGNQGGKPYWSWYGFESREEWCACFVSWAADQCGYIDAGIIPKFAAVSQGIQWFQERGQWQDASYMPAPGDIIFFDWEPDGQCNHVGIVVSVENGMVNTIEGNSNDECRRRSYSVTDSRIFGYGVPKY